MSYHFDLNNYIDADHGPTSLYALKVLAAANGWTVTRSSDGSTAGAGDNIGSVSDMDQTWSWFVLQAPGGSREILFSRAGGALDRNWFVSYSRAAGYTGGDTTSDPTATDEVAIRGTLAGGGNTPVQMFHGGNFWLNICVDDTNDRFYLIQLEQTTGLCCGISYIDELAAGVTGDTDQAVLCVGYVSGSEMFSGYYFYSRTTTDGYGPKAMFDLTGTPSLQRLSPCVVEAGDIKVFPNDGSNGAGVNYDDDKDAIMPVIYGRSSSLAAPTGYKGISGMLKMVGTARAATDLLSVDASKDHIVLGTYRTALPWDGSTTPQVS